MERIIPCIPPTLDGWVYIEPIHGPLGGPLYTWAQYTPTISNRNLRILGLVTDALDIT